MKRTKLIPIIAGSVALIAVVVAAWLAQGRVHEKPPLLPGMEIRRAVSSLAPTDVALIQLEVSAYPGGLVTVRDRITIALLLNGLKKAAIPSSPWQGEDDTVLVALKNGKTVGPFMSNAARKDQCLGPEFIKGLEAAGVRVGRIP